MTPVPPEERHRAPALWVVVVALGAALVAGVAIGAQVGAVAVALTLAGAAVARLVGGGRRPEGVAVRAVATDVVVLGLLAVGIGILALTPGV